MCRHYADPFCLHFYFLSGPPLGMMSFKNTAVVIDDILFILNLPAQSSKVVLCSGFRSRVPCVLQNNIGRLNLFAVHNFMDFISVLFQIVFPSLSVPVL